MICPNCGAEVPAEARFCMSCGHPLLETPGDAESHARIAESAPAALVRKMRSAPISGERKPVTAVFADVVGSTTLAESMDPEEWVDIMNRAFDLLSDSVFRVEGTIATLVGDGLLAFFGAPVAHEDDPERAVLAALAMLDAAAELDARLEVEHGINFRIRVGINTGEVVVGPVGSDLRFGYTAIGDTMNVAARMEAAADPGTVLVTADTQRFIAHRFETEDRGHLQVKGRAAPVHAFRVVGPRAVPGSVRGIPGLRSPLVGRGDDLATLHAAFDAARGGAGGVVSVTGDAGLGKTRLLAEFRARVVGAGGSARWAEGRCLSYGIDIPHHLVAGLLHSLIGVPGAAPERDVRAALHAWISSRPHGEGDHDAEFLAHLLALPQDPAVERRLDELEPSGLLADHAAALRRTFTAAAAEQPLVLVCEDIHWVDPSSVELLSRVLDRTADAPILWLLTGRPQGSAWSAQLVDRARRSHGSNFRESILLPMSRPDGRRLVANLLEIEALPDGIRDLILERSDGNPFFIEEVVRMLIDRQAIERRDGRWTATSAIDDVPIPDHLRGLLLARIDALPTPARSSLLVASVIGRTFDPEVLADVSGWVDEPDRDVLEELLSSGLVAREADDVGRDLTFRHALIQEAAYDLLLKKERQELHRAVGSALERSNPDRLDELSAVLANHFERAGDRDDAIEWLLRAGRYALARSASREARDLLDRAAVLMDQAPGVDLATRIEVELDRAHAGFSFIPFGETAQMLEGVEDSVLASGDLRLIARFHLVSGQVRSARGESYTSSPALRRALDEALRIGTEIGDDHVRAVPLALIGSAMFNGGRYADAVEALEEALPLLAGFEDHRRAADAAATLARAQARLGDFAAASRAGEQASAFAERSGDANVVLDVKIFLGMVAAERGDLDGAIELTREGIRMADEVGNTLCSLVGNFHLGDQQLRQGGADDARTSLLRSQELAEYCDAGSLLSMSGAWIGAAEARLGRPELAAFDGPLQRAGDAGDTYAEALILQLRAETRACLPDPDLEGGIEDLRAASDAFESLGALPALSRVLRDLGRMLSAVGRSDEAEAASARAASLAVSLGMQVEPARE